MGGQMNSQELEELVKKEDEEHEKEVKVRTNIRVLYSIPLSLSLWFCRRKRNGI